MSGGLLDVNCPESIPGGAICETEVSPLCPAGWAYFADDGSEGGDSCLLISPYTVSNWAQANSGCPWETNLLTVASAGTDLSSKLLRFASSLLSTASACIGCSQLSTASTPGSDWLWVDSTSSSNLNCGTGQYGCGLWGAGEPK
jgi:hypothetical protein